MKKEKLYLICPDCHIEQVIRQNFGSDAYFLTALGTVFDMSEFEYAEEVNQFINNKTVPEIIIVNDIQCTFIRNIIIKDKNHDTRTEKELEKLMANNNSKFNSISKVKKNKILAELNIYRQAYELLKVAFIGDKITDGMIKVSGIIYNRENSEFEKLKLKL